MLATLHTRGAAQAVERLVDSFPAQEKDPVRNQLAGSLRAVLSQKLEVDKQEGRVALFELLINTPAVGNLIREGKTHQLPHVIQTGQQVGMITFQQSYQQRVGEGRLLTLPCPDAQVYRAYKGNKCPDATLTRLIRPCIIPPVQRKSASFLCLQSACRIGPWVLTCCVDLCSGLPFSQSDKPDSIMDRFSR
ncbi:twitching motility family protein [Escherichia coli]|uniref:Twitching motility family protein n=1 Tax=Escherichia coli TaxID=562 RepID=A0A376KNN7_ECOLX|nr:twitching motility family protein [Escherichia coli]